MYSKDGMKNMRKVLFVISTLDTGGAQRAVSNITTHFPKEFEIDILLNDSQSISYPYRGNILDLGFKPKEDKTGLVYQLRVLVRRITRLKKLKKTGGYVACYSFLDSANFANILSGNKYCKVIASVRSNLSNTAKTMPKYKYIVNPMVKALYNKADYVVAVSEGSTRDLNRTFGIADDKLVTIYNGYDCDDIESKSKSNVLSEEKTWFEADAKCSNDEPYIIATMGRLGKEKGQNFLVKALEQLREKYTNKDVRLLLIGDGAERDNLINLARELGVEDKVFVTGFQDNPFRLLSHCDVFVLPSLFEGFPNALAEAMVCGVPVIGSDCESGTREILAPGTDIDYHTQVTEYAEYGVLVKTGSEEGIVEAVSRFIDEPEVASKYAKKSRERVRYFSIESVVKKWNELV